MEKTKQYETIFVYENHKDNSYATDHGTLIRCENKLYNNDSGIEYKILEALPETPSLTVWFRVKEICRT